MSNWVTRVLEHDGTKIQVREGTGDEIAFDFNVKKAQQLKHTTLEKGDVWLDLGAHIGCFACRIAPHVKEVYGVEGDKDNISAFFENIHLNGLENCYAIHGAVVASVQTPEDVVSFYESSKGKKLSGGTLAKRGRIVKPVKALACQQMIDAWGVTKVKMSIEGASPPIILGTDWSRVQYLEDEFNHWAIGDHDHAVYERCVAYLKEQFPNVEADMRRNKAWHNRIFAWR